MGVCTQSPQGEKWGRDCQATAPPHVGTQVVWRSPREGREARRQFLAGSRPWNKPIFVCEISQRAAAINKGDGLIAINHNPADIAELSQAAGMFVRLVALPWQRQEGD